MTLPLVQRWQEGLDFLVCHMDQATEAHLSEDPYSFADPYSWDRSDLRAFE